jgi:hypothetical protein
LRQGQTKGKRLFKNFVLIYPDFIEFDELNGKIITKHSEHKMYRIWSLDTYEMLYKLEHDHLCEFKVW